MSDDTAEQAGGSAIGSPAFLAAARHLTAIRDALGESALRLAYHAAVPVALDAELLNLLRVNFFLDDPPDVLPFEVEAELLLSPLFREVGEGLYEIDPGLRNLLLSGLHTAYGDERVRRVAALLAQYTDTVTAWRSLPELELAQRLTALSFLDPAQAQRWLDAHEARAARPPASADEGPGREWYVAMRRRVAENSTVTTIEAEIRSAGEALLRVLADGDVRARLSVIRGLEALAALPDTDSDEVVSVLCRFIHEWDSRSPGPSKRVTPDVQAALRLIGSLPHIEFQLTGVVLTGANLAGLDFSYAVFDRVMLTELDARGIDLSYAQFTGVVVADANLDGARLDGAFLEFHSLLRVSLNGVALDEATLAAGTIEGVTGSRTDGTPVQIHAIGSSAEFAEFPELPEFAGDTGLAVDEELSESGAGEEASSAQPGAPVDEAAMLSAAQAAEQMEQWDRARDLYQGILDATWPGGVRNPDVRQGLVRCYFELGEPEAVVVLLRRALDIYDAPGDPGRDLVVAAYVRGELGEALLKMGRPDEALDEFFAAVAAAAATGDPTHIARAEAFLGAALVALGRGTEAEEHYRRALDHNIGQSGSRGEEAVVLASLADLLAAQGRLREAADCAVNGAVAFRDAGDHRSDVSLLRRIAGDCAQAGIHDTAITLYGMAFQASSESVGADDGQTEDLAHSLAIEWTNQGEARLGRGGASDALADFQTAISYDGDYTVAHSGLGTVLLRLHRYDEALTEFTEALRLDPGDARARSGFGEVRQRTGRFDGAVGDLESGNVTATGFWTAPGRFVTAGHAVQADEAPAVTTPIETGTIRIVTRVRQRDANWDVAVLAVAGDVHGSTSWLTLFAASSTMDLGERVEVLSPKGVIAGRWAGITQFAERPVNRVSCEVAPPRGLSGAPIIRRRDGAVVGMVVGELTGKNTELLAVRAEDIVSLLGGEAAVSLIYDAAPGRAWRAGGTEPVRVFISGVSGALAPYGAAAADVCYRLGMMPVSSADFGAATTSPFELSSSVEEDSDVFVLLLAHRYGARPPGQSLSYTELEYEAAIARNLPVLPFVVADDYPWPPGDIDTGANVEALIAFRQSLLSRHVVRRFTDVTAFREDLLIALRAFAPARPPDAEDAH